MIDCVGVDASKFTIGLKSLLPVRIGAPMLAAQMLDHGRRDEVRNKPQMLLVDPVVQVEHLLTVGNVP